ncbi:MAG: DUF2281 domain-containing protein [Deltaproteobacteria bacterium]|nr:DUF2281 domain-containing protein [Deltaproteobacteria bacterium]
MRKRENNINISELPEVARAELLDFYEFLKARHTVSNKKKNKVCKHPLEMFVSDPIKVDKIKKYTRDELHTR